MNRTSLHLRSLRAPILAWILALGPWVGLSLEASAGSFTALTYNVAGLPAAFGGEGEVNNVFVSPLLNGHDLVLIQEDFFFHDDLTHAVDFPYITDKSTTGAVGSGDGLIRMSEFAFTDFERIPWVACFGELTNASDCLTPKGFSFGRHELEPGVFLDVYNLHAEAGGAAEDQAARLAGLRQMVDYAEVQSAGNAILMMGDINSRYTEVGEILPEVVSDLALNDVWVELVRGGVFPTVGAPRLEDCVDLAAANCEQIDKVFYRNSASLVLTPTLYEVPDAEFQDTNGVPLSDHPPVRVTFDFAAVPEPAIAWLLVCSLVALRRSAPSGA